MLPPKRFHPFQLDTLGLGAVVRAAAKKGARRCLMGIGGSATNDGGFGLARALGWEFLDRKGELIEQWTGLDRLERIRAPQRRRWFSAVRGGNGRAESAAWPAGRDSGLWAAERVCARRISRWPSVAWAGWRAWSEQQFGRDFAREPGAGAAGGLGFGLLAFLGAELQPGFDLFARQAALERRLRAADLVVTGEGAIDRSTLMGKGVGQIARRCRELKIPCIGLAGMVSGARQRDLPGHALTELTSVAQAKATGVLAGAAGAAWRRRGEANPKPKPNPKEGRNPKSETWLGTTVCRGSTAVDAQRRTFGVRPRICARLSDLSVALPSDLNSALAPVTFWGMNLEDHLGDIIRKARGDVERLSRSRRPGGRVDGSGTGRAGGIRPGARRSRIWPRWPSWSACIRANWRPSPTAGCRRKRT